MRRRLRSFRLTFLDDGRATRDLEGLVEEVGEVAGRGVDVAEVVVAVAPARDDADDRAGLFGERGAAGVAFADRHTDLELVAAEGGLALRHALAHREDGDVVFAEARAERHLLVVLAVADRLDGLAVDDRRPCAEANRERLHVFDRLVEYDEGDVFVAERVAVARDDRRADGLALLAEARASSGVDGDFARLVVAAHVLAVRRLAVLVTRHRAREGFRDAVTRGEHDVGGDEGARAELVVAVGADLEGDDAGLALRVRVLRAAEDLGLRAEDDLVLHRGFRLDCAAAEHRGEDHRDKGDPDRCPRQTYRVR
ncbi:MAG: hypothetical protein U0270_33775 [Labilithrix sp.]